MRVLVLGLLVMLATAEAADSSAVTEVRARYAECRALEQPGAAKRFEFQRVLKGNDLGPWQRRTPSREDVYETLTAYVFAGRVRFAGLEQSSPSGDWGSSTTYCYRTNGSLAFRYQVLGTFYQDGGGDGPIEVQVRSYFDSAGKTIQRLETVLNAKTKKPVKATYYTFNPPGWMRSSDLVRAVGATLLPVR